MIDKVIKILSVYSPAKIILIVTLSVLLGSLPMVYIFTLLFGEPYTSFVFIVSAALPLILTPPTISVLLKISKNLKYFKELLDEEIEKNKRNDIILFEQARFALMGEMMANISHQWKQPLNTIGLAVVSLRTSNKTEVEMDKHFDIVEDNVKHLATTVDDFMSFFDKRTSSEIKELNSIVKEIKSIVGTHMSNKKIELEIVVDNNYGSVEVASSISQVILNLLNNAKDAFKGDGKRKEVTLQFTTNEYGLEIECCDNGGGINESIKDKIFDPYFTTKMKNQGAGIGLYMSKEIVQKIFNGKINLSSRQYSRSALYPTDNSGKTCFYIAIPYSENCLLKEGSK